MPTYDFYCSNCKYEFEKNIRLGSKKPNCPKCKGVVKKKLSIPGIVFKGSGFYKTDSRKKEVKPKKTTDKTPSSSTKN